MQSGTDEIWLSGIRKARVDTMRIPNRSETLTLASDCLTEGQRSDTVTGYTGYLAFKPPMNDCHARVEQLITALSGVLESRTRTLPLNEATSMHAPFPTLRLAFRHFAFPSLD